MMVGRVVFLVLTGACQFGHGVWAGLRLISIIHQGPTAGGVFARVYAPRGGRVSHGASVLCPKHSGGSHELFTIIIVSSIRGAPRGHSHGGAAGRDGAC